MVYDCFTFFNEIDLLKIRLEELKNIVDKFVLVESAKSYSGREKPLYFQEYKHEFEEYKGKIIYYLVDDMPAIRDGNRWVLESHQRASIFKGLAQCNCDNKDIILISDADEIPKAKKLHEVIKLLDINDLVVFELKEFRNFLNTISETGDKKGSQLCTVASKYQTLSVLSAQEIRSIHSKGYGGKYFYKDKKFKYAYISNGGWHFSSLGGPDAVLYKVQNFAHSEWDDSKKMNIGYIKHNICRSNLHNNKKFFLKNKFAKNLFFPKCSKIYQDEDFEIDPNLPEYLKAHKKEYKHFFKFAEPYDDSDFDDTEFKNKYSIRNVVLAIFKNQKFRLKQAFEKLFFKLLKLIIK